MARINSNKTLGDQMRDWHVDEVKFGVLVIDEDSMNDASGDMAKVNKRQVTVIATRRIFGEFPIYLSKMDDIGGRAFGWKKNTYKVELDKKIPVGTRIYTKSISQVNLFAPEQDGGNAWIVYDLKKAGVTHLIIMGQSVNACCCTTAAGAVNAGFEVHTCESLLRGGLVKTVPLNWVSFPLYAPDKHFTVHKLVQDNSKVTPSSSTSTSTSSKT